MVRRDGRIVWLELGRLHFMFFLPWIKRGFWGTDFCFPTVTVRVRDHGST